MTSTLSLSAAASFSRQQLTAHASSNIQISPVTTRAYVPRAWNRLPCHERTSATNNSSGNWKHFCSGLTDHGASCLSVYLHDRNTLTYLLTYLGLLTYLRRYHRQRLQIITTVQQVQSRKGTENHATWKRPWKFEKKFIRITRFPACSQETHRSCSMHLQICLQYHMRYSYRKHG